MATSLPSSSDRRGATGPRENLSSGPSLGRPRWDESRTLAPLSIRYLTVGTDARIRVSSVMVLPSSGTLRSQRTRTFLPLSSAGERSATDFFAIIDTAWRAGARVDTHDDWRAGANAEAPAIRARTRATARMIF